MSPTKKELVIDAIMSEIQDIDIAWYLKTEVKDLLKYLHYYKLKNVYENMEALVEYLHLLDKQNTNQIHQLEYDKRRKHELADADINYFLSTEWLNKIWEHKIHQKVRDNDYNLSYIMQWLKGLLLLTADEFCNATPTRMSINRMLWQKELSN